MLKPANYQDRTTVFQCLNTNQLGLSAKEIEQKTRIRKNTLFEILGDLKERGAVFVNREKSDGEHNFTIYKLNPHWVKLRNFILKNNLENLKKQLGHANCKSDAKFYPSTDLVLNRNNYHWKHSKNTAHDSRFVYLWLQCVWKAESKARMSPINPLFPLGTLVN
jgi:hypothetical protein